MKKELENEDSPFPGYQFLRPKELQGDVKKGVFSQG